jgi:microcystin-dependent protein
MAEPFLGEIRMVGFEFAPAGWAMCNGQLLPIAQNVALFSLLGTLYGGNGVTTFALPDLRGRVPIHQGQGPGLSQRVIGTPTGAEAITLTAGQMPSHTHTLEANPNNADTKDPTGAVLAAGHDYAGPASPPAAMSPDAIAAAGGGASHDNMQPSLTVNFIIALQGIFPSQS